MRFYINIGNNLNKNTNKIEYHPAMPMYTFLTLLRHMYYNFLYLYDRILICNNLISKLPNFFNQFTSHMHTTKIVYMRSVNLSYCLRLAMLIVSSLFSGISSSLIGYRIRWISIGFITNLTSPSPSYSITHPLLLPIF